SFLRSILRKRDFFPVFSIFYLLFEAPPVAFRPFSQRVFRNCGGSRPEPISEEKVHCPSILLPKHCSFLSVEKFRSSHSIRDNGSQKVFSLLTDARANIH